MPRPRLSMLTLTASRVRVSMSGGIVPGRGVGLLSGTVTWLGDSMPNVTVPLRCACALASYLHVRCVCTSALFEHDGCHCITAWVCLSDVIVPRHGVGLPDVTAPPALCQHAKGDCVSVQCQHAMRCTGLPPWRQRDLEVTKQPFCDLQICLSKRVASRV